MFERNNDKPGSGRWIKAVAIATTAVAVASLAIVGTVAAQTGTQFNDVPRGHWAYDPIQWAVANGITQGCGDGRNFCPDRTLTRAHMVTFLMRYHEAFGGSGSSTSSNTGDDSDGGEYTLRDYGSTDESISLSAGRYRVTFTLEHDGNLDEFDSITLTVEDSDGREQVLCVEATATGYEAEDSYICRENIEVGTRLGEFDPGRIYFDVAIADNPSKTGNRVAFAEWEIVITER